MATLTLTPGQISTLATLKAFTPGVRETTVSPILGAVFLSVNATGGELVASTTDRYMIARYTHSAGVDPLPAFPEVAIPVGLFVDAKGIPAYAEATLTVENDTAALSWPGGSVSAPLVKGNIPPVARLLDSPECDLDRPQGVNPEHFARLAKVRLPGERKAPHMTMTGSGKPSDTTLNYRFSAAKGPDRIEILSAPVKIK